MIRIGISVANVRSDQKSGQRFLSRSRPRAGRSRPACRPTKHRNHIAGARLVRCALCSGGHSPAAASLATAARRPRSQRWSGLRLAGYPAGGEVAVAEHQEGHGKVETDPEPRRRPGLAAGDLRSLVDCRQHAADDGRYRKAAPRGHATGEQPGRLARS
jgi:hypothetical protein